MKAVLALALVGLAGAAIIDGKTLEAFDNFARKFNKKYSDDEYATRASIFAANLEKVNKMNAEHMLVGGEAVFGVTKFSDLSDAEFKQYFLTAQVPLNDTVPRTTPILSEPPANDVDWRTKGVLTAVKDQGQCGSCWAFSATEAIESFAQIAGKGLKVAAPQQVVSCDKVDGGCNGGWPYNAYTYVHGAGGIEGETSYPYTSGTTGATGTCKFDGSKIVLPVAGYKSITKGEANLEAALNVGPVSVCVDATTWGSYTGGILSSCGTSVDHCVQAVGYTATTWTIRNSWGSGWGESGFMRIARGKDLCLISDYVTYPTF